MTSHRDFGEVRAEWAAVEADSGAVREVGALPTGVVTFLLSDVAGSTRLWEDDEETAAAAIGRHYELIAAAIALHGGERPVEQGEGDSVVGAFARASDAVAAALDLQRAFTAEVWPAGVHLSVRVAIHSGEAHLRDAGNYFGPAVIRCARLRAVAHPGQILISAAAGDLAAEHLPEQATLRDLGWHRLKDLGRPERVFQVCHPDLPGEFPALRSLDAAAHNLPVQLTSFLGRDAELAELDRLLAEERLVVLTGSGGCGKTRLALHAAAGATGRQPDGVWWVELGPLSDPDLVPYVVARTFGLREEEGRPVTDTLCDQLAAVDALVVLDNCEHLIGACAQLVDRLVRAVPGLRVMATSRESLGIPGEVTWPVPSLDAETAHRLFVDRATRVRPGFSPAGAEAGAVTEICRRLDGIPLAIELAAARARMMPPTRIAAALDDRFRLLTGGGRTSLPRQQTLETSVAWSHDLLDDHERTLLRRLSVFARGFTVDAAEAVGAGDPLDGYAVLDLVARLVDKSLVQVDHESGGRYHLLETILLYAGQRLIESGESSDTRDRHLAFFVKLAEWAEPHIARVDGPEWLARLEREHDNLRGAMEWAEASGAYGLFLRLTAALTLFWELHSHLHSGSRWFDRALAREEGPSALRARALWGAAHMAIYGGNFAALARRAPEALGMAELVGDEQATARALNTYGLMRAWVGVEIDEGRADLMRSIEIGERIGDDWAVGDGWKMVTSSWITQDDYDGLAPALEAFRIVAERLGNQFFLGWYHWCVGYTAVHRGDFAAARASLEAALAYDAQLGGACTAGIAIAFLGEVEALTGDYEAVERRLASYVERAGASGDYLGPPFGLPVLARVAIGQGNPSAARGLLEPLVDGLRPLGFPWMVSSALSVLGLAHLAEGDDAAAEAALREAKATGVSLPNPWLVALADHHLGLLARHRGATAVAEDLHHDALALQARNGLLPGVAESLEALAAIAADHGSWTESARLLGAGAALRQSMGLARWPVDRVVHDAEVARARQALGEEAFTEAWSAGETLTVEGAVAYATRARGERKRPSSGWGSLTPTEVEVVKLAATGLTNPEIGERLLMGRGTVKTHLAHVFAKLGIATRAELAAEAARRGL